MPHEQSTRMEFAGSLRSANNTIYEALKLLEGTYKEEVIADDSENNFDGIKLEDVWNTTLEYDKSSPDNNNVDSELLDEVDSNDEPEIKRLKTSRDRKTNFNDKPLAIRARILFIGGNKPMSYLLDALKRKRAIICQANGPLGSRYLKLEFGEAFEMLIYFAPLLVRINAITKSQTIVKTQRIYHVMGVSGNANTIGPLIAKQLEYSSAHATRCLRRCFADLAVKANGSTWETEISEGNALIKFLTIARNTYHRNWENAELD